MSNENVLSGKHYSLLKGALTYGGLKNKYNPPSYSFSLSEKLKVFLIDEGMLYCVYYLANIMELSGLLFINTNSKNLMMTDYLMNSINLRMIVSLLNG